METNLITRMIYGECSEPVERRSSDTPELILRDLLSWIRDQRPDRTLGSCYYLDVICARARGTLNALGEPDVREEASRK